MSENVSNPAASPFAALGKPATTPTPPAAETQPEPESEPESEPVVADAPMAVYTSGSIANLRMGEYNFVDGQMVITESDVAAFEKFLATQPPTVTNGIKRVTTLTIHSAPAMTSGVVSTDSMQPAPAA